MIDRDAQKAGRRSIVTWSGSPFNRYRKLEYYQPKKKLDSIRFDSDQLGFLLLCFDVTTERRPKCDRTIVDFAGDRIYGCAAGEATQRGWRVGFGWHSRNQSGYQSYDYDSYLIWKGKQKPLAVTSVCRGQALGGGLHTQMQMQVRTSSQAPRPSSGRVGGHRTCKSPSGFAGDPPRLLAGAGSGQSKQDSW